MSLGVSYMPSSTCAWCDWVKRHGYLKEKRQYTWEEARLVVLNRLRVWVNSLPASERDLKIIWGRWLLSPNEFVKHVELLDEVGQEIVTAELKTTHENTEIEHIIIG